MIRGKITQVRITTQKFLVLSRLLVITIFGRSRCADVPEQVPGQVLDCRQTALLIEFGSHASPRLNEVL